MNFHETTMLTCARRCTVAVGLLFWPFMQHSCGASTPQRFDTVVFGGVEYSTWQLPLAEVIIKEQEARAAGPLLRSQDSSNHKGYVAKWGVSHGFLWLLEFNGKNDGEEVPVHVIIRRGRLPMKATWFTGVIHIPVGDLNHETNKYPVRVQLRIKEGKLIDVTAVEDAPPIYTLDGHEEK